MVVAGFAHQIQSEYYGGNRSVSIEGIVLQHFSALPQTGIESPTKKTHVMQCFIHFSGDSKQDAVTTSVHSKSLIELLKEQKVLMSTLSTIWGNTDGCAEQYRCASALYLMSVVSQCYSVIIYCVIIAHGHIKEIVDGLKYIDKHYIYQLLSNVQLTGSKTFYLQIIMHSCTSKMMSVWLNNSKNICLYPKSA